MDQNAAPDRPASGPALDRRRTLRGFNDPWIDLNEKTLLLTGGTGSFGRHFVRTVLQRYRPRRLIVFSRDAYKQQEMATLFPPERHPSLRYFIGDMRDRERLELALRDVEYVVHAAGMNQLGAAEYNPFECMRTNVFGAENLVYGALQREVKKVLAISCDKAVTPIDLYGASKLASDKIFAAANNLSGADGARFSVVRYGSILGSRLSFDAQFQELVRAGAALLPIMDERMTRFFMTLDQSVNFALSSLEMMRGGETFVPKIPSALIVDVASTMAPLLKQQVTGLPPGEKLHATMMQADESYAALEMDDRYVLCSGYAAAARNFYAHRGARPLREGFRYSSESCAEQLDVRQLRTLVEPFTASDAA
jgi:UDP-N-acetylglucosamine 4,6-dehydratase/5-epimerase